MQITQSILRIWKFSKKLTSTPGLRMTLSSEPICLLHHCFGYVVSDVTFSTTQNIYFSLLSFFAFLVKMISNLSFLPSQKSNHISRCIFILTMYCIITLRWKYWFYSFKIFANFFLLFKSVSHFSRYRFHNPLCYSLYLAYKTIKSTKHRPACNWFLV